MITVNTLLADTLSGLTAPEKATGGLSGPVIALDAAVFVVGVALLGGLLVWIGKRIFIDEKY